MKRVRKFSEASGRVRYLTEDELPALLKACRESKNKDLLLAVLLAALWPALAWPQQAGERLLYEGKAMFGGIYVTEGNGLRTLYFELYGAPAYVAMQVVLEAAEEEVEFAPVLAFLRNPRLGFEEACRID